MKKYIFIFVGLTTLILSYLYFGEIKKLIIKDNNSNLMNQLVTAKYEVLSSEVNYFETRTGFSFNLAIIIFINPCASVIF